MRILIKVITNSSKDKLSFDETTGSYKVWVKAKPMEGKANIKVLELISDYFKQPKSKIRIIQGSKFSVKIVEVGDAQEN